MKSTTVPVTRPPTNTPLKKKQSKSEYIVVVVVARLIVVIQLVHLASCPQTQENCSSGWVLPEGPGV